MYTLFDRRALPELPFLDGQDGYITVASGAEPVHRSKPVLFGYDKSIVNAEVEEQLRNSKFGMVRLSPSFITAFDQGAVLSGGFFVCDRYQRILAESFRAYGALKTFGFIEVGDRKFRFFDERCDHINSCAVVVGIQTNLNYFHWLYEALPRILLIEKLGLIKKTTLLMPPMRPWMAAILADLNLEISALQCHEAGVLTADMLLMPARGVSNIHTFAQHGFAAIDRLLARHGRTPRGRRFYISRRDLPSRRLVNEDEIIAIALQFGFEVVYPEKIRFTDQIAMFSEAEVIAGPFGAGLANAGFMSPGGALIEIAPEGRDGDATLFANLCHHRGLRYAGVVGPVLRHDPRPIDRRDFTVDSHLVRQVFEAIC